MSIMDYLYIYEDQYQQPQRQQQQVEPQQVEPQQQPQQVEPQAVEFENVERLLIYRKIRELLYELVSSDLEGDDYNKSLTFLNILLTFFETFSYDQLVILTANISEKIFNLKPQKHQQSKDEDEIKKMVKDEKIDTGEKENENDEDGGE